MSDLSSMDETVAVTEPATEPFFLVSGAEMVALRDTPPASYDLELIRVDGSAEPRPMWVARCPVQVGFRDLDDILSLADMHVPAAIVWTVHKANLPYCYSRYVLLESTIHASPGGMPKFLEQAQLPRRKMDFGYVTALWKQAIESGTWSGNPAPKKRHSSGVAWRLGGMVDTFMSQGK